MPLYSCSRGGSWEAELDVLLSGNAASYFLLCCAKLLPVLVAAGPLWESTISSTGFSLTGSGKSRDEEGTIESHVKAAN